MTESPIKTHRRGHVLEVTLDRPKANAIDSATSREMGKTFLAFRDDPDLRVAIITGAGQKFFCPGWDLKAASEGEAADTDYGPGGFGGLQELPHLNKPVIAAVNGYCLAGGLELALACDFIIASDNSYFGLPEVSRAIIPVGGGTQRLPRTVHFRKALEMLLTGDRMGAQEAYNIGLVNKVVPHSDLMSVSDELANKIISNGPLAVRAIKELAYKGMDMTLEQGLSFEKLVSDRISATEDAKEGPLAFTEKRKAVYKGR